MTALSGSRLLTSFNAFSKGAGIAVLYYGMARLGLLLAFEKTNASPVWPPSGFAFAAVLGMGYRAWPGILVGAFWANIEGFLTNQVANSLSLSVASGLIATGNTLEAVSGAYLLRRFVGQDNPLDRVQNVFKFVCVALLMCLVSAAIGPTSLSLLGIAPWEVYGTVWFTWWVGDVAGVLILTPVLLTCRRQPRIRREPRRLAETALFFATLLAGCQIVFAGWSPTSVVHPYMLAPILLWAAFRLGPREVTTAVLLVSGYAVWSTAHGSGPFVGVSLNESLLSAQIFVGLITVTAMALVAVLAERKRAEDALNRQAAELSEANKTLEERGRLLAALHQIGQLTLGSLDLDQILDNLAKQIVRVGIFRSLMVALVDEESRSVRVVQGLVCVTEDGVVAPPLDRLYAGMKLQTYPAVIGLRYDLEDDNITAEVARTGEMRIIEGWDDRFDRRVSGPKDQEGKVSYFIPVKQGDRTLAVLATASRLQEKEEILRRIEAISPLLGQVAIAIEHALLYREVQRHSQECSRLNEELKTDIARRERTEETLRQREVELRRQNERQAALLRINRAVQEMARPSGLEQVMQVCVDEVRNIGLDVHAMAIHRVIDPDQKIIETFRVSPGETISRSQRRRGKRVTECWQAGQILYEKDIYKNDVREIENFRNKFGGLPIRCHLNVPFSRGVISAHSTHPDGFSESDTEILRHIAEIFSVGISRVEDLERVEASQKGLRQSEERYRNLVEHSPYAIFIHVEGKIVFANSATLTLLGASAPENLIGKSVFDFVHPDYLEMARERTRKVHEERRNVLPIEQKFIRLDGTVIEVETQASFFTYQDQPAIQAIVRDISERKRLEQQLFQAQKMEAIGTLAGGIAHDFNNELTGIIGFAQLALLEDLSPQARECIARIPEQGKRAANLISQLLVFSRQAVVEKQTVSLLYLVKEAIRVLEHTLPENIAIRLDAPREVAPVNADPTQMQQVFMNLCINASHAMPDGGDLTVVLEDVTLDEEYCRQYVQARPGHYVCLSVRDTGAGMAPEVQARIFEPFFTTKEVGKGTGLGLAMVYGIVKEHGGHVNVYSEVGKGSEFKVYLPALETGTVKPGVAAQESLVGGTETLLLVEDQEWVMAAGKRMLERLGYTVLTATNGEEAIETYRAHRDAIALVITDMVMPRMGGQGLYEALRQIDPTVKALMISGYSLKEDVSDLRARGLKGFVQKPFDIYKLAQDVRRALDE